MSTEVTAWIKDGPSREDIIAIFKNSYRGSPWSPNQTFLLETPEGVACGRVKIKRFDGLRYEDGSGYKFILWGHIDRGQGSDLSTDRRIEKAFYDAQSRSGFLVD